MANEVDPYRAYNFKLQINGVNQGHFTECSGLGIKIEPVKYREAGTSCTGSNRLYAANAEVRPERLD